MKKTAKKILSFILSAMMIFSLAAVCFAADEQSVTGSNWMSTLEDSRPITAINMPGTHDSATQNVNFSAFARTQSLSVLQQLNVGVRFLDIRLKKQGNAYFSVHSVAYNNKSYGIGAQKLKADDIIADCEKFLASNPDETILMSVKEETSNSGTDFYTGFYNKYVKDNSLWFAEDRVPTLGEVRGKIVLLRRNAVDILQFDETNCGIDFSEYPLVEDDKIYNFKTVMVMSPDGENHITDIFVQDSYKLAAEDKWTAIKAFLDFSLRSTDFNICVTSSIDKNVPLYNAQIINEKLMNYNFVDGKTYGIISMDFATKELCEKIYMSNKPFMTNDAAQSVECEDKRSYAFLGELIEKIAEFFTKIIIKYVA
ncbi:MAG: phosphatidylinositol-specific phospholipase C domain-containing protein [Acutalibacteraceae bacterium]